MGSGIEFDPSVNPSAISKVIGPIDDRLVEILSAERARWVAVDGTLDAPFDALQSLIFSGGKRIRPAFFHWAHVGAGGDGSSDIAIDAGAAIEMLHAFALAHDDVMDHSSSRRGEPSIWKHFSDLHYENDWAGNAKEFGEAVAILVGDLAHVIADKLIRNVSPTVSSIWDELRLEVNIGQYLDVLSGARRTFDHAGARRILEYKTGRYSVQRPLHLGVAIAGRHDEFEDFYTDFGRPVGVAFQLRDDLLGVFGDEETTGKPVGDDLREGKPTSLVAAAYAQANELQTKVLHLIGNQDLTRDDVEKIQQVIIDTGADQVIESEIKELTNIALQELERSSLNEEAMDALTELALFVAYRTY
ncbi:MAG: polyprenyl synthetase family protein [Acidimicrobiales bacterium]|jgi:geranylgeranyl diphosphate synthase type I|nr:polyprenyl synthetase family protein [Acidimicrobiales bacterium]MDP6298559.1 polyprenyl synthetase family protein [Acidimicrobiales bacterium]HJM29132.1 polyprenyl synthetase family protein [Acidimicrobiales bacterium]HJM97448.1 polyprenyl synthetase family protein [Acidimicrobiales bacterium]